MRAQSRGFKSHKERKEKELWNGGDGGNFGVGEDGGFGEGRDEVSILLQMMQFSKYFRKKILKYLRKFSKEIP